MAEANDSHKTSAPDADQKPRIDEDLTIEAGNAKTTRIDDPISYFPGEWEYERELFDKLSGTKGHAFGSAKFTLEGEIIRWREVGVLMVGAARTRATREMTIEPEGNGWMVFFDDGRPFHPLDMSQPQRPVEHLCVRDLYECEFTASKDRFVTKWRVRGPSKDQLIETTYRHIGKPKLD